MSSEPHARLDAAPRVQRGVFLLLAISSVGAIAGTAFSPYLVVHHPLILVLLAPEYRHVALAATKVPVASVVLVSTLRKMVGLTGSYGLGYLYGDRALRFTEKRFPMLGRFVRAVERLFLRLGTPLLIVAPSHTLSLLAGASGTALWAYFLTAGLGQALWFWLTYRFGEFISDFTTPIIEFLSRHLVSSTLVSVALVVSYLIVSRLKKRRESAREVASEESGSANR